MDGLDVGWVDKKAKGSAAVAIGGRTFLEPGCPKNKEAAPRLVRLCNNKL